ncbi:MAG: hypothetical protein FJX46_17865 [Alphaproteobacteria bacterium]|nr:hypothetical protein [Alphaproteobacteria bacterium]
MLAGRHGAQDRAQDPERGRPAKFDRQRAGGVVVGDIEDAGRELDLGLFVGGKGNADAQAQRDQDRKSESPTGNFLNLGNRM